MNALVAKSAGGGRKECPKEEKNSSSSCDENQHRQEFDLRLMTPSVRTVTADVHFGTRSSSYADADSVYEPANEAREKTEGVGATARFDQYDRQLNDQSLDEGRRRKNGFEASAIAGSPAAAYSNSGARFKFPAVKMGGFFSRKKGSCPALSSVAEGGISGDQSPTLSAGEHGLTNNSGCNKEISSPVHADVDGKIARETNPLLFRRLNNRLRGRKTVTPAKSQADFDQVTSPDEGGLEDASAACRLLSSRYPQNRTSMAKRLFSREDPGPSNVALITVAAVATTAAIVDEIGAIGGSANDVADSTSKSSSFATALDACYKTPTTRMAATGAKYKLIKESQIQVCRLSHPRTLLGKLTSSKLLRRWEAHTLILEADEIRSKTPVGFLEQPIKYVNMEDVHALPQWDSSGDKFCVRVFVPEGSVLLQTNRAYARNQWLYSILWRRNLFRYRRVIESNCSRPEVLLRELKCMVEQALCTPLQGSNLNLKPIKLACLVLQQVNDGNWPKTMTEPVICCVAPLLDTITVVSEISPWLSRHCQECPRSRIIDEVLADVAILTLKKNMDFGKYASARAFVQNFLFALSNQNDGTERIKSFVRNAHGRASACPHPRVLSNLVSVCLAAVHALYDTRGTPTSSRAKSDQGQQEEALPPQSAVCLATKISACSSIGESSSFSSRSGSESAGSNDVSFLSSPSVSSLSAASDTNRQVIFAVEESSERQQSDSEFQEFAAKRLACLAAVFETMSEFDDWRLALASLLQPIPFPDDVLSQEAFLIPFSRLIRRVGTDSRCDVHLSVLGMREGKEGWFHLFCPGGPACVDDGDLYASLLEALLRCCCRRKKFLSSLNTMLGPLQLLALRECQPAMEALCHMLELEVVEGEDLKLQMVTALQSTPAGKLHYSALCDRQVALRELQQKGGPRKLTLPSKSTDADLGVLLSSGSFGNLEWLSLAFTNVTSACAEYLIKLPALRYLNLWSTQFGDVGLQLISEHLHKLQVLNLCETPVTDKGLSSLSALTKLRKLNLNSTQLSAKTFQMLRANLPALQEADVRYTDAWCADEFLAYS